MVGKMEKCVHCAKGKARKTKLGKEVQEEECKVGERIGIDISGSKEVSLGGKRYAQVKIGYGSNKLFVSFLKKKSEGVEDMMKFLKKVQKERKKLLRFIRMDWSGENMKFKEVCEEKYPEIKFELTAKDMPQQNGKVERVIATIWDRLRSMMDDAGIPKA